MFFGNRKQPEAEKEKGTKKKKKEQKKRAFGSVSHRGKLSLAGHGRVWTYYAGKCVVERVPEREADFEPLDVGQVARYAAEERRRDAHAREIQRANGDAPRGDARQMILLLLLPLLPHCRCRCRCRCRRRRAATAAAAAAAAAAHEAERLHGAAREEGRGGGWGSAEGAQVGYGGLWEVWEGAVVVA